MAIDWLKFDVSVIEVSTFFALTKQTTTALIIRSQLLVVTPIVTAQGSRTSVQLLSLPNKRFFDFSLSLESKSGGHLQGHCTQPKKAKARLKKVDTSITTIVIAHEFISS